MRRRSEKSTNTRFESDKVPSTEAPKILQREESADSIALYGADQSGTSVFLKITRRRHRVAEVWLVVRLANGEVYNLPSKWFIGII